MQGRLQTAATSWARFDSESWLKVFLCGFCSKPGSTLDNLLRREQSHFMDVVCEEEILLEEEITGDELRVAIMGTNPRRKMVLLFSKYPEDAP